MARTAIVRDHRFLKHLTDPQHPENPRRLEKIYEMLSTSGLERHVTDIHPSPATEAELLSVHTPAYVRQLTATMKREASALTPDTLVSPGSFPAACLAVGGIFQALQAVVAGQVNNAFVLARPPGHHAERSRAMGYCLLNTVALGATHARRVLGLKRVMVVDWDLHHGNGTQHIFEQDSAVLFFSTHQYPHFPGSGLFTETGIGRGEGYTVNIPIPKGYGDGEYVTIYQALLPSLAQAFQPQLILVSAGFDTHRADPSGGMQMTAAGFAGLTRCLLDVARSVCNGRLVLCLEGGYHGEALARSVRATLMEMAGNTRTDLRTYRSAAHGKKVANTLRRMRTVHRPYWPTLTTAL